MKKTLAFLAIVSSLFPSISCDDSEDEVTPLDEIRFDLSGARAILYSQEGGSGGRAKAVESSLFKIDDEGNISPVVEGIQVVSADAISWGVIVSLFEADTYRTFYVTTDNEVGELDAGIGNFIGENNNGDVVFSDASILRKATLAVEAMQTTLNSPHVQAMSGNFAIVTDASVYQIFNTVTGLRYNVDACNGPKIVAMDATRSLIDDCQNKIVIEMTTGERKTGDIPMWNHEGIPSENGAVILTQGLAEPFELYYLGEIAFNGALTLVSEYGFSPGSSSCMNCSEANAVLFKTGDYFIVRELSKVTVVKRGEPDPYFILSNYNVTSVSVTDNLVYYLAEDTSGNPIVGIYDLTTGENEVLSTDAGSGFTSIQVINQ